MKVQRLILGCAASAIAPFLMLLVVVLFWVALSLAVTKGSDTGIVVSLEQRGFFVKTWEGRMADGLTFSVDARSPGRDYNVFLLTESKQSGTPVRIEYTVDPTAAPWRGESGHLVTSVTQLPPPSNATP